MKRVPIHTPWGLTPCELQVMEVKIAGHTAKTGGRVLGIDSSTFEKHVQAANVKIAAPSTLRAAVLVDRHLRAHGLYSEVEDKHQAATPVRRPIGKRDQRRVQ